MYRITFDSTRENKFLVHCDNGVVLDFQMSCEGLYYHNMDASVSHTSLMSEEQKLYTVQSNIEGYTE